MSAAPDWLVVERGDAPLIVSIPHAGTELGDVEPRFVSPWLARKDADWQIPELYDFAGALGATIVRTALSRSLIDVNRDPCGASLYPGQATTELCPTTTFDGEPLYRPGRSARRAWRSPSGGGAISIPIMPRSRAEIARLRARFGRVALFDAHSIRSRVPRLFEGELPHFNLGTNSGKSCDPALREARRRAARRERRDLCRRRPLQGRLDHPRLRPPEDGVHALQMELACRAYMREPERRRRGELADPARSPRAPTRRARRCAACWRRCWNGLR